MTRNIKPVEKQLDISLQEIRAVADQIARKFNPQRIILFGSYTRGNSHPSSDVDLLVVLEENANELEIEVILSVPHKFPMDILVRSPREIEKRLQMGVISFATSSSKGWFYMNALVSEWIDKAEADYYSAWREYRPRKHPKLELTK